MATKLQKTIRREIEINGELYTVAVSPEGVKLTRKGFRKGTELSWRALLAQDESHADAGMTAGRGSGAGSGASGGPAATPGPGAGRSGGPEGGTTEPLGRPAVL
jgi:hypothetical protein